MREILNMDLYEPREHLSCSSMCNLARCPRRFFYNNGCRLGQPGPMTAANYGQAMHHGIPHVHRGNIPAALEAFEQIWDQEWNDPKRNPVRAKAAFEDFALSHRGDKSLYVLTESPAQKNLMFSDRISIDEIPFAIDIGLDIPLVGRIDAAGMHRDTGLRWGVEYKTTSELSTRFLNLFSLNPQVLTYTLALNVLSGEKWEGLIIEGLLTAKTTTRTLSNPITVSDQGLEDIVDWYQQLYGNLQEYESGKYFPKNLGACTPYPGFYQPGYMCDYEPLCQVECWEELLGMFEQKEKREFEIKVKDEDEQKENGDGQTHEKPGA